MSNLYAETGNLVGSRVQYYDRDCHKHEGTIVALVAWATDGGTIGLNVFIKPRDGEYRHVVNRSLEDVEVVFP